MKEVRELVIGCLGGRNSQSRGLKAPAWYVRGHPRGQCGWSRVGNGASLAKGREGSGPDGTGPDRPP